MKYLYLYVFFLFSFCNKTTQENKASEENKMRTIWTTKINSTYDLKGFFSSKVLGNEILFYTNASTGGEVKYLFLNKTDGEINGEWNDLFEKKSFPINGLSYLYNNILTFTDLYGSYAIDVKTKKTLWRNYSAFDVSESSQGFEKKLFYSEIPEESNDNKAGDGKMIMTNVLDGTKTSLFNLNKNKDSANAFISSNFDVKRNEKGELIIYFTYTIGKYNKQDSIFFYKAYNVTQNQFIDSLTIDILDGLGQVYVNKNKVYFTTPFHFVCMDLRTHNIYWKKDHLSMCMSWRGFTLDEQTGIIYASIQDTDPTKPLGFFLKAIDANTGNVLWQKNIGNHCTKPFETIAKPSTPFL